MVQVVAHCGLDFVRIEWGGSTWRFDVPNQDSPPEGWVDFQDVEIVSRDGEPMVIGPDGQDWPLIPADPEETPGFCF